MARTRERERARKRETRVRIENHAAGALLLDASSNNDGHRFGKLMMHRLLIAGRLFEQ